MGKLTDLFKRKISNVGQETIRPEARREMENAPKVNQKTHEEILREKAEAINPLPPKPETENEKFLADLWKYEPYTEEELRTMIHDRREDWYKNKEILSRLATTFPSVQDVIADTTLPDYERRIKFINHFDTFDAKIAAILCAFVDPSYPNYEYFAGRIQKSVKAVVKNQMSYYMISQYLRSIIENPGLTKNIGNFHMFGGSKEFDMFCEFRDEFYRANIMQQEDISVSPRLTLDHYLTGRSHDAGVYHNGEYDAGMELADYFKYLHEIGVDLKYCDTSAVSEMDRWQIKSFSLLRSESDKDLARKNVGRYIPNAMRIVITAKDWKDILQKLPTLVPDLIACGADFRIPDFNAYYGLFNSKNERYGHVITIKQGNWNAREFFRRHPELLEESNGGVDVNGAFKIGGALYGYKVNRGDHFTLEDFIAACEEPLLPELSNEDQWYEKVMKMSPSEWDAIYDPEFCETLRNFKYADEHLKKPMTAEEFEAYNAAYLAKQQEQEQEQEKEES